MSHKDFIRLCMKPDQEGALALLDQRSDWLDKRLEEDDGIYVNGRWVWPGSTAIIAAAVGGSVGLIDALLKRGADVRKVNRYGDNALMEASQFGHVGAATLLLDRAPDLLDSRSNGRWTPLYFAASNDKVEIWQLLIARGADLRVTDYDGATPLTVYGRSIRLTPIVKQQRLDQLQAAFADGPHPSQVQRRRDERWARRWPFMLVMVCHDFQPTAVRKAVLLAAHPPLDPADPLPPLELLTAQQRRAYYLMAIFGHEGFWKIMASYL